VQAVSFTKSFMFDISFRMSDTSNGFRMKGKLYHLLLHIFNPILKKISGFHFDLIRFAKQALKPDLKFQVIIFEYGFPCV